MEEYGLLFDDPIISTHHILRGKIICSKRTDYVYVQYPRSIWNKISESDRIIREITPTIVYLKFFPQYEGAILDMETQVLIRNLKAYLRQKPILCTKETIAYIVRLQSRMLLRMAKNINCSKCMVRWILFWI